MLRNKSSLASYTILAFLLFAQIVCAVQLQVSLIRHDAKAYSFGAGPTELIDEPTADQLKAWVKELYDQMKAYTRAQRMSPPKVMAILFVFTDTVAMKGTIIAQSSTKGANDGTQEILDFLNTCVQSTHRKRGNCAEIGAMARAAKYGYSLNGARMALYGAQGAGDSRNSGNHETHMSPCQGTAEQPGCAQYLGWSGIYPLTKRSRIEGIPRLDKRNTKVVESSESLDAKITHQKMPETNIPEVPKGANPNTPDSGVSPAKLKPLPDIPVMSAKEAFTVALD